MILGVKSRIVQRIYLHGFFMLFPSFQWDCVWPLDRTLSHPGPLLRHGPVLYVGPRLTANWLLWVYCVVIADRRTVWGLNASFIVTRIYPDILISTCSYSSIVLILYFQIARCQVMMIPRWRQLTTTMMTSRCQSPFEPLSQVDRYTQGYIFIMGARLRAIVKGR